MIFGFYFQWEYEPSYLKVQRDSPMLQQFHRFTFYISLILINRERYNPISLSFCRWPFGCLSAIPCVGYFIRTCQRHRTNRICICIHIQYMFTHLIDQNKKIYYKELANVTMEAGKSKIHSVGWHAGASGEPVFQIQSKGWQKGEPGEPV